ncbi:unnamed protein product [Onchocerca ochengi]|uniref:Phosphatidylinositol-glycan biosynthesis class W protein n=1 Tax=Onchocerca ochengi TaxID=42157 RepID=A0A182E792_ONCOC|nr:unnamed protein product [Onchocerca ochengi]
MGNGTTQAEILFLQFVGPMSLLLRNIAVPRIFHIFSCIFQINNWLIFIFDLLFIMMPVLLILTLLSDYIPLLLLVEAIIILIFVIVLICDHYFVKQRLRTYCDWFYQINDAHYLPTKFVTYMRSHGLICTAIAILAVDFNVFPNRFAKTSTFGRSLMDLGTATFVYCFAVTDIFRHYPGRVKHNIQEQKKRFCSLKPSSSILLILLGIARTVLLNSINYHYSVIEYGVHWNFFITLGMLRLIVEFLGRRCHLLLGIVIGFTYQYFLTKQNLQEYLLSNETERTDFISKNREGIFSLFGYLSLYYFASAISSFLFTGTSDQDYCDSHINFSLTEKRKRIKIWFNRFYQLLLLTVIIFGVQQLVVKLVGLPSRRIANMPYVLEMINLNKEASTEKNVKKILLNDDENSLEMLKPFLMDSINQYGLAFFLVANILTGLVNKSINTSSVKNHYTATAIITAYMFTCITIIHLFARLRKKMKHKKSLPSKIRPSWDSNSLPDPVVSI